ncbi:hypothetical protein [Trujillonella endophytica]|uniref:Uncharacterized protein n=1 Tax=Trujillonella endophytica TaxID=673521 RepID=A0A1H8R5J0_9ACTN|nr:hypothetical protein [Trujillella endophytica]SEO61384.1 hypothetical protein SAMN05660991_01000 [Trujillella endophytica]
MQRRRLAPAQLWTLVLTAVIAVVATTAGLVASGSGGPSLEEQLRDVGIYGDFSDYSDYPDGDDVFC